jgi:hypothetical protein
VHDFFAVLQHYGIATGYLDFTTDPAVAGFFATDGADVEQGRVCTIYCLDSANLEYEWSFISRLEARRQAALELVRIDVRNLWRLQAQKGVFLYVNYNWDVDYPLDRIVFPYTSPPAHPTRDEMYPRDKSALEQLLDQYFERENATRTEREFQEMHERRVAAGAPSFFVRLKSRPNGIYPEAFKDPDGLTVAAGWPERPWEVDADERYGDAIGRSLVLDGDGASTPRAFAEAVERQLLELLAGSRELRGRVVEWRVQGAPAGVDARRVEETIRRGFNGMRHLPYGDDDIAACIGRVALLGALGFGDELSYPKRRDLLLEHFGGEVMEVGFGTRDGAGSAGWATVAGLHRAVRPDIASLLKDDYVKHVADLKMLMQLVYDPRVLFLFEPFKTLFAREVVPIQVVERRKLVHFNAAALATFGNA